ncbi:MAG TPA: ABC transporter ATP-binding protein, partial [Microbacterium sp.]|nr:ABC transporter ATP-binding protein [Microbacterium sp.]
MTAQHAIRTEGLVAGYGGRRVVDGIDMEIPSGRISVIVGANACGKSTLLKTISRLLTPQEGAVVLDGKRIDQIPTKELARTLGLLPQQPIAPEGIAVADLVGRGRHPHQKLFRSWT